MAAKLQCEICGGKLIGRPGGVFECDSCGMEYDTAWAKAKIQEITGTVKVEGTVEVTGKVQIDGPVKVEGGVNKEALLQRGRLALEDEEWDKAKDFFEQILAMEPENAEAWLGLAIADLEVPGECELQDLYFGAKEAEENAAYQRFLRFAPPERAQEVGALVSASERKRQIREADREAELEEKRKAAEERRKAEAEQKAAEWKARIIRARICMRGKENTHLAACMKYSAAVRENGTVFGTGDLKVGALNVGHWNNIVALACGESHVVGLRSDGLVFAKGKKYNGVLDAILFEKDAVAIACGEYHTAAVTAEGRVLATKSTEQIFENGQNRVHGWTGVKAIACGPFHTVGLRLDGTVLATQEMRQPYDKGQSRVEYWRDVQAIACGYAHTIGLRTDGTVLAAGYNYQGQCNVQGWNKIIQIACGHLFTAGLRANGTVVVAGDNSEGQCNTGDWENIVAIVCGRWHIVGLRMDGTVVAAGRNDHGQCDVQDWNDIMALACGDNHTIALREDGSVVSTKLTAGSSDVDFGQCEVRGWKLFSDPEKHWNKLIADTEAARAAAEEQEKTWRAGRNEWLRSEQVRLTNRRAQLLAKLPTLTGMFKAGRKAAVEQEIQQINIGLSQIAAELNANPTVE